MTGDVPIKPDPFQIWLRIRHPSIDPAAISRELQLVPEHSFMAGERRRPNQGVFAAPVHTESYWLGRLHPVPSPPELDPASTLPDLEVLVRQAQEVQRLAGGLSTAFISCASHLRRRASFLLKIQSDGGQIDLRVEISPGLVHAFTLAPHVARTLSELGIAVEFELTGS